MNRTGVVGTILLLLVLGGCGSGQTASSDPLFSRTRFGFDSVDWQAGEIRLIGVAIASPGARGSTHIAGDSAGLFLTIANDGDVADVLTGAATEAAEHVVLRDGDAPADPHVDVPVPPGGVAVLRDVTGLHLELSGLRDDLRSGFSVPVRFRFRDAGSVTFSVPIRTYTDVRPDKYLESSW